MSSNKKRPKRNGKDVVHTIAKSGLSALPILGGPASELFSLVITPSLEKRRDEWIESIAKGLKELEEQVEGFKIENLKNNDAFVSVVMQASQAAIRTHQKEKLEALRNAVLNSALPDSPEENIKLIFISLVNSSTPLHLSVLNNTYELSLRPREEPGIPEAYTQIKRETIFPFEQEATLFDKIVADLSSFGLITSAALRRHDKDFTFVGLHINPLTELGKKFLDFITSPIQD